MATVTLTLAGPVLTRAVTAITTRYGYQANILNNATPPILVPNPQTPQEFTRQWLITQMKNAVKEHESNTAGATAASTSAADVETNFIVT